MLSLPLLLMVAGITLFVAGDIAWLMRQTRQRAMDLRVTGALVGGGAALIALALLLFALG